MSERIVRSNLPLAGVDQPAIVREEQPWPCQRVGHDGTSFVYCGGRWRYVVAWTSRDQWRSPRKLRVCGIHGQAFAKAHGLQLSAAAQLEDDLDALEQPDPADPRDLDQPYARIAGATRGGER